jgi:HK97 family phage major capsid protein
MDNKVSNRPWFKMAAKASDEAELTIFDEIGGWGQTVDDFKRAVDEVKDKGKIKLLINSPGGIVTDGWAVFNILSRIREKLTVEVVGLAASMASVVALAGKELVMDRGTYLMIHDPWTFALGSSDELRKMADVMDTMKADIVRLYEERSALNHDEILTMMTEETWITADDAVEYGFASRVEETAQAAASIRFDFSKYGFNRAPSALGLPRATQPADTHKEGIMDPKDTMNQNPPAAAPAPAQASVQEPDEKIIAMLAERVAPEIMKRMPAGRVLETEVKGNKVPKEYINFLRGKIREREMPMDSAAIIKTTDGFGIPTIAMPDFLTNLNFYSIARRWGAQIHPGGSKNLTFTADIVQNAAAIIAETGSYADKGEPSAVTMTLAKVGGRYSITEEADEDTVLDKFNLFQKLAAVAIAKAENAYFLAGTGSAQPKGIFAETATKTVASASAITYAEMQAFDESLASEWDVLEEFNPLNPSAYRGPIYIMHPTTAATLRALNDGGSPAKYYFQDEGARMLTIFGRPVIRDTNCPTITNSAKVIALVNWNSYAVGERRPNLAIKVTEDPDTHATNWDFAERVDGKLWNTAGAKILAMHA